MNYRYSNITITRVLFLVVITSLLFCCRGALVKYAKKEYNKSNITIEDQTIRELSKSLIIDVGFQAIDKNLIIFENPKNKDIYTIQFPKKSSTSIRFDIDLTKSNTSNEEMKLHEILNSFSISNPETILFKHNRRKLLSFKELKIVDDNLSFDDPKIYLLNIIAALFPLLIDSDHFDEYELRFIKDAINTVKIELIEYELKEGEKFIRPELSARIGSNSNIKIVNGNYDLYNNVIDGNFSININLENLLHNSNKSSTSFDNFNFELTNFDFYNDDNFLNLIKTDNSQGNLKSTSGRLKTTRNEILEATFYNYHMDISNIEMNINNSDVHMNGNTTLNLDFEPIKYERPDDKTKIFIKKLNIADLYAEFSGYKSNIDKIELKDNVQLLIDSITYQNNEEKLKLYDSKITIQPLRLSYFGSEEIISLDSLKFSTNNFRFENKNYNISSAGNSKINLEYHSEKDNSKEKELIKFDFELSSLLFNQKNYNLEFDALNGNGSFQVDDEGFNANIERMELDIGAGNKFGNENYTLIQDNKLHFLLSDFNFNKKEFYGNVLADISLKIEQINLDDYLFSFANFYSRINSRIHKNSDDLIFELFDGTEFQFKNAKIKRTNFDFESEKIEFNVDNYFKFNLKNGTIKL